MFMSKPNVILINCDDLGYGDLGCYGSSVNQTPAIDKLAGEGLRFTSFYAASPVCSPSRAGLMTGCYPPRVSINRVLFPGDPFGLDPNEYTIPRLCKDNGYRTMIIGKWHCGDQPTCLPGHYGFDRYYGLPYSNDMGMQAGRTDTNRFPPLPLVLDDTVLEEQPDQRGLTERYVEQAVRFLRQDRAAPFFLYLAHMHVHLPLYAAQRFVDASQNGDYGACVAAVDWALAVIVHELKRLQQYENTILIFTSDNGSRGGIGQDFFDPHRPIDGPSNAPLRGSKNTTWEGGQRVPFIFSWPARIEPARRGTTTAAMAANIDLLPTLARLIGSEIDASSRPIDGVDLADVILSGTAGLRQDFVYFGAGPTADAGSPLEAIRCGRWKLHLFRKGQKVCELYDLEADLSETCNLHEQYPDLVIDLTRRANGYAEQLGDLNRNISGRAVRGCHITADPRPLTHYNPNHPYIIALYDKNEAG
jgi:arylsulfatase A-like enzyme